MSDASGRAAGAAPGHSQDAADPASVFMRAVETVRELVEASETAYSSWYQPVAGASAVDTVRAWARQRVADTSAAGAAPKRAKLTKCAMRDCSKAVLIAPASVEWEAKLRGYQGRFGQLMQNQFQEVRWAGAAGLPDSMRLKFLKDVAAAESAAFAVTRLNFPSTFNPLGDPHAWVVVSRATQLIGGLAREWTQQFADRVPPPAEDGGGDDARNRPPQERDRPTHAPEFEWVRCHLGEFTFTLKQRPLVRLLWEDWEAGGLGVGTPKLLAATGDKIKRVADAFRTNTAWKTLIVPAGRPGIYKLNLQRPDRR